MLSLCMHKRVPKLKLFDVGITPVRGLPWATSLSSHNGYSTWKFGKWPRSNIYKLTQIWFDTCLIIVHFHFEFSDLELMVLVMFILQGWQDELMKSPIMLRYYIFQCSLNHWLELQLPKLNQETIPQTTTHDIDWLYFLLIWLCSTIPNFMI